MRGIFFCVHFYGYYFYSNLTWFSKIVWNNLKLDCSLLLRVRWLLLSHLLSHLSLFDAATRTVAKNWLKPRTIAKLSLSKTLMHTLLTLLHLFPEYTTWTTTGTSAMASCSRCWRWWSAPTWKTLNFNKLSTRQFSLPTRLLISPTFLRPAFYTKVFFKAFLSLLCLW